MKKYINISMIVTITIPIKASIPIIINSVLIRNIMHNTAIITMTSINSTINPPVFLYYITLKRFRQTKF